MIHSLWLQYGQILGVAWALLAVVLIAKARREERGLLVQFPDYAAYRQGRRFLIPGLW